MDWERIKAGIIDKGIVALLAGALGVVITNGQSGQMASDVTSMRKALDSAIADLKVSQERHDRFDQCTDKRLALIEAGVKRPADCAKGN